MFTFVTPVSTLYESSDVKWAAILNWSQPDGILRVRNDKKRLPINFLQHSPYEEVRFLQSPQCYIVYIFGESKQKSFHFDSVSEPYYLIILENFGIKVIDMNC